MDLYHNDQAPFTRWIVANGLLREPLVVVDVGVQGGEHPRWRLLGEHVRVFGFDAIAEAVDRLNDNPRPNRAYRTLAIGDEDGRRTLYVPANTFGTSFHPAADLDAGERIGLGAPGKREVAISRLDTLFAAGELPPVDYLKIDTEGFEAEVLRGGRQYLAASNVLAVCAESTFEITRWCPDVQFIQIAGLLLEHRLEVFDLSMVRFPRPSYATACRAEPWAAPDPMSDAPALDIGQPASLDVLFARDFVAEDVDRDVYRRQEDARLTPTPDKLIKSMIVLELHGLMDCAFDVAAHFRDALCERLDVRHAMSLLRTRPPHARNMRDVINCLSMIAELRRQVLEARSRIAELEGSLAAVSDRAMSRSWTREAVEHIRRLLASRRA